MLYAPQAIMRVCYEPRTSLTDRSETRIYDEIPEHAKELPKVPEDATSKSWQRVSGYIETLFTEKSREVQRNKQMPGIMGKIRKGIWRLKMK